MKKTLLLLLFASIATASENTYSLIVDLQFSPYTGAYSLLFATRGAERIEDYMFRNTGLDRSKDARARAWRLSDLISVWLPLNYEAMLIQHEIFGHGYRIRNMGSSRAGVVGYQLGMPPPYGGGGGATSYYVTDKLSTTGETCISAAGVEATAILANQTKFTWLCKRLLDPRQAFMYLFSQQDITFYIGSLKMVRSHPEEDFKGHDIDAYLFWLNATYPDAHLSSSRLRSLAWINALDPFTYYSIWSLFHYISSGRDTKIPMINVWRAGYLFGARLGLTPFGPEVFFENYISAGSRMFYGYLKAGRHAQNTYLGAGVYLPILWKIKRWDLGLRADLWAQPRLLLSPGRVPFTEITSESLETPLYPYSKRHAKRFGAAASLLTAYNISKVCGAELEFGAKSRGFLPGNSLWSAPILRGGVFAYF